MTVFDQERNEQLLIQIDVYLNGQDLLYLYEGDFISICHSDFLEKSCIILTLSTGYSQIVCFENQSSSMDVRIDFLQNPVIYEFIIIVDDYRELFKFELKRESLKAPKMACLPKSIGCTNYKPIDSHERITSYGAYTKCWPFEAVMFGECMDRDSSYNKLGKYLFRIE